MKRPDPDVLFEKYLNHPFILNSLHYIPALRSKKNYTISRSCNCNTVIRVRAFSGLGVLYIFARRSFVQLRRHGSTSVHDTVHALSVVRGIGRCQRFGTNQNRHFAKDSFRVL